MRDDQRLLLGLDEAGRGSVLGPLVVGAFAVRGDPDTVRARLRELGARDSKTLLPARRSEILPVLRKQGRAATARAEPSLIDRHVAEGGLNRLELTLMARLVLELRPSEVYVDACDPDAERFGRQLRDAVGEKGLSVEVVSRHKADRDDPIVGAASIVAKVTRDRAIERLRRAEGREIGSGYPSDEVTRGHLRELLRQKKLPPYVRRSWSTVDTLMRERNILPLESYER